jgi:hypothetical protein
MVIVLTWGIGVVGSDVAVGVFGRDRRGGVDLVAQFLDLLAPPVAAAHSLLE